MRNDKDIKNIMLAFASPKSIENPVQYPDLAGQLYEAILASNQQSVELRELLAAMENFSDAIKVCRTAEIKRVLRELNGKIQSFKQVEEARKSMPEKVFSKIIGTIQAEYGPLIAAPETSELDIIQWCVRRDLLQQAMTLYTEWMPIYFEETKICYPVDENIKNLCELQVEKQKASSWQKYFITQYTWNYGSNVRERMNKLYYSGKVDSKFSLRWQDVVRCLEQYNAIRDNRNRTNHASTQEHQIKTANIKKNILKSLEVIRSFR